MIAPNQLRDVLEALDVGMMRKMAPHMPPFQKLTCSDDQVLVSMHMARTSTVSVRMKHRAYSHRWLTERGHMSMLPDDLKPMAERMYPRIVEGVGIAVKASDPLVKHALQKAMGDAVEDAFAEGRREPEFVKARMREAADRTRIRYRDLILGRR